MPGSEKRPPSRPHRSPLKDTPNRPGARPPRSAEGSAGPPAPLLPPPWGSRLRRGRRRLILHPRRGGGRLHPGGAGGAGGAGPGFGARCPMAAGRSPSLCVCSGGSGPQPGIRSRKPAPRSSRRRTGPARGREAAPGRDGVGGTPAPRAPHPTCVQGLQRAVAEEIWK